MSLPRDCDLSTFLPAFCDVVDDDQMLGRVTFDAIRDIGIGSIRVRRCTVIVNNTHITLRPY